MSQRRLDSPLACCRVGGDKQERTGNEGSVSKMNSRFQEVCKSKQLHPSSSKKQGCEFDFLLLFIANEKVYSKVARFFHCLSHKVVVVWGEWGLHKFIHHFRGSQYLKV